MTEIKVVEAENKKISDFSPFGPLFITEAAGGEDDTSDGTRQFAVVPPGHVPQVKPADFSDAGDKLADVIAVAVAAAVAAAAPGDIDEDAVKDAARVAVAEHVTAELEG